MGKIAFRIHFILIDKKGEQSFFRKDVSPVLSFHKQEIPKIRQENKRYYGVKIPFTPKNINKI